MGWLHGSAGALSPFQQWGGRELGFAPSARLGPALLVTCHCLLCPGLAEGSVLGPVGLEQPAGLALQLASSPAGHESASCQVHVQAQPQLPFLHWVQVWVWKMPRPWQGGVPGAGLGWPPLPAAGLTLPALLTGSWRPRAGNMWMVLPAAPREMCPCCPLLRPQPPASGQAHSCGHLLSPGPCRLCASCPCGAWVAGGQGYPRARGLLCVEATVPVLAGVQRCPAGPVTGCSLPHRLPWGRRCRRPRGLSLGTQQKPGQG